jgi:lysophospholipase L1-like esterase
MNTLTKWSAVAGLLVVSQLALAGNAYISLGDSLAFGYQPGNLTPSLGIQGYVSTFANGYSGGFSKVINLGVPEETTSSFVTGGQFGELLNQNYTFGVDNQYNLLKTDIASQQSSGNTVKVVSLILGANDLLDIDTTGMSISQIQSAFDAADLASAQRIAQIVQTIVTLAPTATILLNQYYNPYDILPAGNLQREGAEYGIDELNAYIAGIAHTYGAKTVDFGAAFNSNIALYTHMGDASPDIHLNNLGYQKAGQLMLAAVPEPTPLAIIPGLGLAALLIRRRR